MKLWDLIVPLLLLAVVVAVFRFQFHWVIGKVTNENDPNYQVMPVATPFQGQLCGKAGENCTFPGLYPTTQPFRGLTAP
jgi:hypothetical protein